MHCITLKPCSPGTEERHYPGPSFPYGAPPNPFPNHGTLEACRFGVHPRICLQCRRHRIYRFDPWIGKIFRRRKWQPTPVLLPGESHGRRSLVATVPGVERVGNNWVTKHSTSLPFFMALDVNTKHVSSRLTGTDGSQKSVAHVIQSWTGSPLALAQVGNIGLGVSSPS